MGEENSLNFFIPNSIDKPIALDFCLELPYNSSTMTKEVPQNFSGEEALQVEVENTGRFARAIAVRNLNEQQRTQMRLAELTDGQYQPLNPLFREALLLTFSRMTERLLIEPSALPANPQTLTTVIFDELGDDVFDAMVRDLQKDEEEPLSLTGSQLRSMCKATTEATITSFVPSSMIEGGFSRTLRQIDEARKIAAERNVDPASVYENDDLYIELVRRSSTSGELARSGTQIVRQITPERMNEMIMNMIPEITRTIDEVEDEPVIDQEKIREIRQEMSEDPEFKKTVRIATLQYRRAFRTLTGEQIIRFWGQEGLDSLPKSVKASITKPDWSKNKSKQYQESP